MFGLLIDEISPLDLLTSATIASILAALMAKQIDHGRATRPAKSAWIADYNGRPTIHVDGIPKPAVFYALTHAFGGRFAWEEVAQRNLASFADAGVRLFQVDLHFQDFWLRDQPKLDLGHARRQVRGVLDVCADAAVVLRVHVNAPFWWNEAHPDECTRFADGPVEQRRYGPPFHHEDGDNDRALRASLASELWRREAGVRVEELCRRLSRTEEGRSVVGIHVAGGIYGEWHYWGFLDHDPDTGPAMTAHFRNWLSAEYGTDQALQEAWGARSDADAEAWTLANATVPNTDERNRAARGFFRDPVTERRVIDYFTCQQEVVAEDIEYFCRIVRDTWPRRIIIGVFYGYFHMTFNRQSVGGHLCIERILESPYVDYVAAPQTYWSDTRAPGGSGNSRGIVESARLHGKLWMDELDNGYQQANPAVDFVRYMPRNDRRYLQLFKRSTMLPVLRGGGFWYYDFGVAKGYGWWDSPLYLAEVARHNRYFVRLAERPYSSQADVLFVWSMESFFYVKPQPLPICEGLLDASTEEAFRCGVSGDHVFDFDLEHVSLDQYRAVVFMNVFSLDDERVELIRGRVATNGRTIIWNYLPGAIRPGRRQRPNQDSHGGRWPGEFSLARVSHVTGFTLVEATCPPTPTMETTGAIGEATVHYDDSYDPFLIVADEAAEPLGSLAQPVTEEPASARPSTVLARKKSRHATAVFSSLPIRGSDLFRRILEQAGCHVYARGGEVVCARSGLLLVHAAETGRHEITLRGGRTISLEVQGPATLVLDAATGHPEL